MNKARDVLFLVNSGDYGRGGSAMVEGDDRFFCVGDFGFVRHPR